MSVVGNGVASVAAARRVRLPAIRAQIANWRLAETALLILSDALDDLLAHPGIPPAIARQLGWIRLGGCDLVPAITATVEELQRLERRVGRDTVAIGVSGGARAGKTTLLRSITGLGDEVLPAAPTAVRCRIHHVPGRQRALLDLHTFDSFRSAHLVPRHAASGLASTPGGVAEFGEWRYGADGVSATGDLREMQAALPSFEGLLERPGQRLELTGDDLCRLAEYVSYPEKDDPTRRYLAVRDVRVECEFPNVDLGAISIVELPGGVGSRENDYDVDQVVLVKRRTATWTDADTRALDLLATAGGADDRRDATVFVAVNVEEAVDVGEGAAEEGAAGSEQELREAVALAAAARGGVRCEFIPVDARSTSDVVNRLLTRVVEYCGQTLPAADGALLAARNARSAPLRDDLAAAAVATNAALRPLGDATPPAADDIHSRTADLRSGLAAIVLGTAATVERGADPAWEEAVRAVHRETVEWIADGFGLGRRRRSGNAVRETGSADAEPERIRLGLCDLYAGLDRYLAARTDDLFEQVAGVFKACFGSLLDGLAGRGALRRLAVIAESTAEPCDTLAAALRDLLTAGPEYRTHLRPRIRPAIEKLGPSTVDDLVRSAERVTDEIRADLLRKPNLADTVLFAALARFADVVTRCGPELHRIAAAHRRAVWPDAPAPLDRADARVVAALRAADDLLDITTALAAPTCSRKR